VGVSVEVSVGAGIGVSVAMLVAVAVDVTVGVALLVYVGGGVGVGTPHPYSALLTAATSSLMATAPSWSASKAGQADVGWLPIAMTTPCISSSIVTAGPASQFPVQATSVGFLVTVAVGVLLEVAVAIGIAVADAIAVLVGVTVGVRRIGRHWPSKPGTLHSSSG